MNDSFMKEKPILPLLLSMALPMVLSMAVNALYNIVDSYFVAKISEKAMTALSLVFPMQNFINAVSIGFGVGLNALTAIYLGAGKHERANETATIGTALSLLHGVIFTIVCIAVMPSFLAMFTKDGDVISLGVRYTNVVFLFSIICMAGLSFEKIFQSVGHMKVAMCAMLAGCITNIILDPMMIFGIGPFPAMGIEGAALATGIGQSITLIIYIIVYIVRPISIKLKLSLLKPDMHIIKKLYAIGIPAILNLALPSLLTSALNSILAVYSEVYVLILGVYYKLQTFLYLPASGFIQGMRPLISYNYGAGEKKRVHKIYNTTLLMCLIIMICGTVVCQLAGATLIGLFTENPETISLGAKAMRIISLGFAISSISVTASGALEALGKGKTSLIISLCRYIVIIIPCAFVLSKFFGPNGVWSSFIITEFVTAAISMVIYKKSSV